METLHNKEETLIAAAYQDIKNNQVVYNIDNCLVEASKLNKPIILGIDSNAHSQLWQCDNTNQRGHVFEETIATHGLYVCNIGTLDRSTDKAHQERYGLIRRLADRGVPSSADPDTSNDLTGFTVEGHLHRWRHDFDKLGGSWQFADGSLGVTRLPRDRS